MRSRDFTLQKYRVLLEELLRANYRFQTFEMFMSEPRKGKIAIMRHDVDRLPENALDMARIEHELGIQGSYYWRVVKGVWNEQVMREVAALGHEVAYHYEDLTICKGDKKKAVTHFETQLARFRSIYPSKTICMHGSPLSRFDNKDLWKHYSYKEFGIIAEPYFDLDFSRVLYLTDTGRRWDGDKVSMRDRPADASINEAMNAKQSLSESYSFRSTGEIIEACKQGELPDQIMFTFHPQRWTDKRLLWYRELFSQNIKNAAKYALKAWRQRRGS